MESISGILTEAFESGISKAYPDLVDPPVVIAQAGNNPKFGDYQCNSAMPIANLLKQQGMKKVNYKVRFMCKQSNNIIVIQHFLLADYETFLIFAIFLKSCIMLDITSLTHP